jgi:predicted DNA-binding antitoxin AbrB/MazE fold protein
MTKEMEAIYEGGVLRPLEQLDLPEGSRLEVILISRDRSGDGNRTAASVLAEIAALPLEGPPAPFSGADHDSVLYPREPGSD